MTKMMKMVIWFVVLMGIMAVVGAVVIGNLWRDAEVSDDPYEEGLRWDDRQKKLAELGWKVRTGTLNYHSGKDNSGQIDFSFDVIDRDGSTVSFAPDEISILASRPAGELDDVVCSVQKTAKGLRAVCPAATYGLWDMVLTVRSDKSADVLKWRVYVKQ